MPLTLRIQSYRKQAPAAPAERRFDRRGGTIGRGDGSDLQLPDPDKYISRTHCKVEFDGGSYSLVDLGSNASWVNERPLGAGRSAVLADGDVVTIGDYVLQVALDAEPAPRPEPAYAVADDSLAAANILDTGPGLSASADPLGLDLPGCDSGFPAFRGSEPDHVPPQFVPLAAPLAAPLSAPLAAPPSAPLAAPLDALPAAAQTPAQPAAQAMAAPQPSMLIPDDYDPLADYLPPRVQPAAPPVAPPAVGAPQVAAPADEATPVQPGDEVLRSLLRGLGLAGLEPAAPPAATAELAGAMLLEATAGTMSVLLARALTKRESRLELTVLGAQANNPLKFFPDAQAALAQMLTGAMPGYMPAVKAFGSAFDDLKAHELAVIAGMRAALSGVLARFDPAAIERTMESQGLVDKLLGASRKARMCDRMVEQYREVAREAEDDFQRLFGERFSAAYEDQVGRLGQGRGSNEQRDKPTE